MNNRICKCLVCRVLHENRGTTEDNHTIIGELTA